MSNLGKNATANLFNDVKVVSITVATGTATTTAGADTELIGGIVTGVFPSAGTAADKVLNSVVLTNTTGVIVVTLGGNTTADQTFKVVVRLATGNIA